jgi:hypothetical protein
LLVSDFPLPAGGALTGVQSGSVPSPVGSASVTQFPFSQASLQQETSQCRPRRCDDELEEPRNRCFKGLYVEGLTSTEFIQWSPVDCLTGRELSRSERDNVIDVDFPRRGI